METQNVENIQKVNQTSAQAVETKESQSDILIRLASNADFFSNDLDVAFAAIEIEGHREVHKVQGRMFRLWLTKLFFEETGKAPSSDAIQQALGVMEMTAFFKGETRKLQLRIAESDGNFYYDLADPSWRAIEISSGKVELLSKPPILFYRTGNTKEQAIPDFDGKVSLILNHIRLKNNHDKILYLVYLVTCLIPNIPHPILVVAGEQGAAKSTMIRMTRSIVDPAARTLLTLPTGLQDTALSIANNYMPCFDNLDIVTREKSDLLCMASTGGAFSKRALYTDSEESILELLRCVTLNGINIVAQRADLLDRSIIAELRRVEENERKEERTVWEEFERDKPLILGGALRLLAEAMSIYPEVQLPKLYRMADFTRWGYAIAEAAGIGGDKFLEAYKGNLERTNIQALESHPVAAAVIALLDKKPTWTGSVAELLETLEFVAIREKINTRVKTWPKASHALSMRLSEIKSNLEKVGIRFDIRNNGNAKIVTFETGRL
ncbi:hypothetical protein M5X11_08040 [Paenibacillus alginolyticus]|uniref:hypothetical protein n=1 Tax=Paenibacillus alginolyticus TaxID=59839 RepID=UPI00041A0E63|nr:hypothetical protein [Paenibacillus alginolyticus]MCY9664907.1 hypothetical protein [Paenibacillus alginolyticus]